MKNKLKEARFFAGIIQAKLGLRTGISASTISKIENGLVQPTEQQKKKLAKALRVSVTELFPPPESSKVSIPSDER